MNEELFDLEALEALLIRKSYHELTEPELLFVSRHVMSESEYNDLRDTLKQVKKTFDEEKINLRPKPEMKEALLEKFEKLNDKRSIPKNSRKTIPLYYRYAGVAAVLLVGLFIVISQFKQEKSPDKVLAYQQEKPVNEQQRNEQTIIEPAPSAENVSPNETPREEITQEQITRPLGSEGKLEEEIQTTAPVISSNGRTEVADEIATGQTQDSEAFFVLTEKESNGTMSNMIFDYSTAPTVQKSRTDQVEGRNYKKADANYRSDPKNQIRKSLVYTDL